MDVSPQAEEDQHGGDAKKNGAQNRRHCGVNRHENQHGAGKSDERWRHFAQQSMHNCTKIPASPEMRCPSDPARWFWKKGIWCPVR